MLETHQNLNSSVIISCLVSLISVLSTQFTLSLIPLFLPSSPFLILLPLSAPALVLVIGFGRFCKRVFGVRASAPAFVFFSIFFIWAVYLCVVRQDVSFAVDIAFNAVFIMVIIGLCRIMTLDPGFVSYHSSHHELFSRSPLSEAKAQAEESQIPSSAVPQEHPAEEVLTLHRRVKYCRHCKNYVKGFDHHCPAFGNCVGQRNHFFFTVLLVGFVASESLFIACASQFTAKPEILNEVGWEVTKKSLVLGAMLFCVIQVLWQVVFIIWHVYCACCNIKTDEWINWEKYPEFQVEVISQAGTATQFVNPYDKGILCNLKEFLTAKG